MRSGFAMVSAVVCGVFPVSAQVFTPVSEHIGLPGALRTLYVNDASLDMRTIVGSVSQNPADPLTQAPFRWSQETGIQFLSTQERPFGAASAVSDDASIVVLVLWNEGFTNQASARWTDATGAMIIADGTCAFGGGVISGDGLTWASVIVGSSLTDPLVLPVRVTGFCTSAPLRPAIRDEWAWPYAINTTGTTVAGGVGDFVDGRDIFRWTSADGFEVLPALQGWPFATRPRSRASLVSDDGTKIYGSVLGLFDDYSPGEGGAFVWTQATGTHYFDLERPDVLGRVELHAMTPDVQRLVGSAAGKAFLWRADGSGINLDTYFKTQGVDPSGTVMSATRISGDGRTLIGQAFMPPDIYYSWIATLPATFPCDSTDFNNNGVSPEDVDVIAFFEVLAGAECATCNDIDFNNNSVFPEDADVMDFFNVLAGGGCM